MLAQTNTNHPQKFKKEESLDKANRIVALPVRTVIESANDGYKDNLQRPDS